MLFLTLEGCFVVLLMFIVFVNVCTFSGGLEGRVLREEKQQKGGGELIQ